MRNLTIAFFVLMQVACITTRDISFTYEGEKELSQKKIDRKFRKDEAFCRVEGQKAAPSGYGSHANLNRGEHVEYGFVNCMISRDWEPDSE